MCGHWNIFLISQFFYISYFGILTSKCGMQFFFHYNLTSELVRNFLLHTEVFILHHLPIFFFLPSILLGTLSFILIAYVSLNHKRNFLLIHFFISLSLIRDEGNLCICCLSNSFSASTYVKSINHFSLSQISLYFISCGPKCTKFRELQLFRCISATSAQFLP